MAETNLENALTATSLAMPPLPVNLHLSRRFGSRSAPAHLRPLARKWPLQAWMHHFRFRTNSPTPKQFRSRRRLLPPPLLQQPTWWWMRCSNRMPCYLRCPERAHATQLHRLRHLDRPQHRPAACDHRRVDRRYLLVQRQQSQLL